jgi:hypothetical protein
MHVRKRWVLGAFSGFFFGLFLGLTLLGFGVYALDSKWLVYLPVIFLVVGIAGALWGPLGARPAKPAPVAAPPDVSQYTGTPAAEPPPPPPGDPVPPPAQPPSPEPAAPDTPSAEPPAAEPPPTPTSE